MLQHILAPFQRDCENAWLGIEIAESLRLGGEDVVLWSIEQPANAFAKNYSINLIKPFQSQYPFDGHLMVISTDIQIASWFDNARFEQISMVHHQHKPMSLMKTLSHLTRLDTQPVSIVYTAQSLKDKTDINGTLMPPLFNNSHVFRTTKPPREKQKFTVGRIGEDTLEKHHFNDPVFYQSLVNFGFDLKLSGSTCLKHIETMPTTALLLPELNRHNMPDYLVNIDCLYYCTAADVFEGLNTWAIYAMAYGIPIVAHVSSGIADLIRQGENGFLFEKHEEALSFISSLASNETLYQNISLSASRLILNNKINRLAALSH